MINLLPVTMFGCSAVLTPGPNNFMIMNSGLTHGIRKSIPHYCGIAIGFPLMTLLVSLGLGAFFVKYAFVKSIFKFIGSAYMLFLAWQILRSNKKGNKLKSSKPVSFTQAILFQWVNVKAWLMAASVISIFTLSNNYFLNALYISAIYFLICLPGTAIWLYFGKAMQTILKNEKQRVWFNICMAVLLVASVFLIIVD